MNAPEPQELPIEISVQEVKSLLDAEAPFVLLDCRERDEHAVAAIAGSQLEPMSELQQRVQELGALKDQHVVVHCHLGGRSLQVTHWLRQQGFAQVQNMTGGIDAWSQLVDPSVPRY